MGPAHAGLGLYEPIPAFQQFNTSTYLEKFYFIVYDIICYKFILIDRVIFILFIYFTDVNSNNKEK